MQALELERQQLHRQLEVEDEQFTREFTEAAATMQDRIRQLELLEMELAQTLKADGGDKVHDEDEGGGAAAT